MFEGLIVGGKQNGNVKVVYNPHLSVLSLPPSNRNWGLAGSVMQEKREGTFRRLLVAPMSRPAMLAGKLVPYYIINLLQLILMLGVSSLMFKMSLGYSPAGLVAVSLAAAATATGLGVPVASLARTEAQVGGLAVLLLLTLSALGGCFVPRFIMPEWLQTIGLVLSGKSSRNDRDSSLHSE
ncbi:MAG: ABC transporter permease [Chloroflexota bacterium]|nr:ABC transporter permease [Chloroflexota bacterium]